MFGSQRLQAFMDLGYIFERNRFILELIWSRGGEIVVAYHDIPITDISGDEELTKEIEANGKRTVKILEDEFLQLLGMDKEV